MTSNPNPPSSARKRNPDLLPNEQEISYEAIHDFFARNKAWIVTSCFVLVLAAASFSVWRLRQDDFRKQAETHLAEARSPAALEAVARDYPGTRAALLALIQVGDAYFEQKQWDQAAGAYQALLNQYGTSLFAPSAAIGLAAILEATGKNTEALAAYRKAANDYPSAFQCSQARFAAARLLETTGQLREARQAFEEFISSHPQSSWKNEAVSRLQKINTQLQKTAVSQAPAPAVPVVNVPKPAKN